MKIILNSHIKIHSNKTKNNVTFFGWKISQNKLIVNDLIFIKMKFEFMIHSRLLNWISEVEILSDQISNSSSKDDEILVLRNNQKILSSCVYHKENKKSMVQHVVTNNQWTQLNPEEEFSLSETVTRFCFISFAVWVAEPLGMRVRSIFTSFAPRVLLLLMEGKYLFQKCIFLVLKESLVSNSISWFRETRWVNFLLLSWYGCRSLFLKKGKTTNKK